jgi:trk system potassium uptake protein TrkA
MKALVVGGGRLVYHLARALHGRGHEVVVVCGDEAHSAEIAGALDIVVCRGDGTEEQVLEDAGAGSADELLALTGVDQDNLAVCQLAKLRFQVPRVIALVNDPDYEDLFRQLGVDGAFSPTSIVARLIEQRAGFGDVVGLSPVAGGRVDLTEVRIGEGSPACERKLADLDLPRGALVGYVFRGDEIFVPHGGTALARGDRLLVITLAGGQAAALRVLTGRGGR